MLALLRHGDYQQPPHVPSAHLPAALNERGRQQAYDAAGGLWDFAKDNDLVLDPVIDSSSLLRAWQTATRLAEGLREQTGTAFSIEQFDELAERGLGAAANLPVSVIEQIVADDPRRHSLPAGWKRNPHFRLPFIHAESLMNAGERVAVHLQRRAREPRAGSSLKIVVGHGGAFRHAACHLGLIGPSDLAALSMHHCAPVYVEAEPEDAATRAFRHLAGEWKRRATASDLD